MLTHVSVPVGILERAAFAADSVSDFYWDLSEALAPSAPSGEHERLETLSADAVKLARALYAAARGEEVDWSRV